MSNSVVKKQGMGKHKEEFVEVGKNETTIAMIQELIPLGLAAVNERLQEEVSRLAGERYERGKIGQRWGSNPGSVFLGDQKVKVVVPRVRDKQTRKEMRLESYEAFQNQRTIDAAALGHVLNGISQRKYERAATHVPETFGISRNSVSRLFIKATAKKLETLSNRSLEKEDIIGIFIDGTRFSEVDMIIALGIRSDGSKMVLGFTESHTENATVCKEFLLELKDRGLSGEHEILFIIDGSKGLRKGIELVFGDKACVQRCQWHKRENVVSYLSEEQGSVMRERLQAAYEMNEYEEAKAALMEIKKDLSKINQSAASSLAEGLEETLTLHRLGLFKELGRSFKTTNCIESLNKQVKLYVGSVCNWKTSDQRRRWLAASLLEIEPRLHRVSGHEKLGSLRKAMSKNARTLKQNKRAA